MQAATKVGIRSLRFSIQRSRHFATMSALQAKTAVLLLERVPAQERAAVIQDVTRSLNAESSNADIGLAAALCKQSPDQETQKCLVSYLEQMIHRDDSDRVASICKEHSDLEQELIISTVSKVASAASVLRNGTVLSSAAPVLEPFRSRPMESDSGTVESTAEKSNQLLGFLNRTTRNRIESTEVRSLLQSCLALVGISDRKLSQLAKETLLSIVDNSSALEAPEQKAIWSRIESLTASEDTYNKSLGFSIWLRWLSAQPVEASILRTDKYWQLIVDGLRKGDSERRKCALQILKDSINASIADPSLTPIIVADTQISPPSKTAPRKNTHISHSDHRLAPQAIQKQYQRFASTFETIVLGRYLNQVIECEADLDFLSSAQSVVKPVFLYTLLASALDQKLQDSNRKFIGTWIMRSNLRSDVTTEFMDFLRHNFLPWVMSGTLFTSTLRKQAGVLRSQHGEVLAQYVSNLLLNYPQHATTIIDCILDSVLGRHGNNFPYALVYLIEGIGRALAASADLRPTIEQLEKLHKLATYSGLPEVVRDFALARCWNLCHNFNHSSSDGIRGSNVVTTAADSWDELKRKSDKMSETSCAQKDGNIASLALLPSKREANEQIALGKCHNLMENIDTTLDGEKMRDIWSDLEYLEYPKGLLIALPELILDPKLIQAAITAPSGESDLAEILAEQTKSIMELADSRSYLLPTLVASLRTVALKYPASTSALNVDDLIMHLARHPPAPTMDALLEHATINLLQSIDPRTANFGYEFYSGRRESYGFAALIDLASRLDAEFTRRIHESLSQRWVNQKTPAPSVSHWKTSMQLQIMLVCSERFMPTMEPQDASELLEKLHYILSIEPLPTYRYLIEWMIARVYIHHHVLRATILDKLSTKDHHSNPKFLASLMKLGVMIAKTQGSKEGFALQLATVLVPLAASSKVIIRHEAQWQVPILLDHARKQNWTSVTGNTAICALDDYIRSLERFDDPPLDRQIDRLDPIENHNLTHLVSGAWWALDQVEQPNCSYGDFIDLYANDDAQGVVLPAACIPLGPPLPLEATDSAASIASTPPIMTSSKTSQNIESIAQALSSEPTSTTALQTKGAAYLQNTRTRHSKLCVVASLVDNPYNLGGISRVSEIFGAGALYLTNPHVTSAKDFVSVSVSSHHHIPILPLAADQIASFVAMKKKEEGFSVVGIEQTDRSVILGEKSCVLPEKCILVLGSEREGIPAVVLTECDVLVEIAQIGLTRSLNVQTAAGIVLCEYARQHKK